MDEQTLNEYVESLEQTLHQQVEAHEQLLSLLQDKRAALRDCANERVSELCQHENQQLQTISELEKKRAELVGALTLHFQPDAQALMRLSTLAEHLPEPARGRLLVLRQRWRERMQQVAEQSSITRRATESLVQHMQGLVETIGMLATGVCTYDKQGGRPERATAMSTINVTA